MCRLLQDDRLAPEGWSAAACEFIERQAQEVNPTYHGVTMRSEIGVVIKAHNERIRKERRIKVFISLALLILTLIIL